MVWNSDDASRELSRLLERLIFRKVCSATFDKRSSATFTDFRAGTVSDFALMPPQRERPIVQPPGRSRRGLAPGNTRGVGATRYPLYVLP